MTSTSAPRPGSAANDAAPRPASVRRASALRRPWHLDYLHARELARDIAASSGYLRGRLLDVGSGSRPYAPLLPGVREYIGLDITPRGGLSVGGLAGALPFAAASFDSLLSTQTLEHVEDPAAALREMARVLKPGGYLVLTAPQTWRLHEQPFDFFRYTRYGLAHLLAQAGLEAVTLRPQGGVWMTVGQIVNNAVHQRWRMRVPVYALYLLYLASNMLFGALDRRWHDEDETINYLAVARKPGPNERRAA